MSELSPIRNLKNLKKDMEHMTYQEKLTHIWTYYKWVLVVVLILIMAVSVLLASIQNKRKITLLGGVTVNVQLSEEGKTYLNDDYKQIIGTGNKRESIVLSHTNIEDIHNTSVYESNYYAVMSLLALCTNQEVDYLILDQTGFEAMLIQKAYLKLEEVYTPEEITAMGEDAVFAQMEGEEAPSAIAIDITDTAFIQANAQVKDKVYFVYVANSIRVDTCRAFYEYLLSYQ
ncbi:MAG: hypothetical protein IKK41_04305 [Oscillospiraceae bacterium]|nr:hypothetical protein [Oscillospiraceae bacterium]